MKRDAYHIYRACVCVRVYKKQTINEISIIVCELRGYFSLVRGVA